MDDMVDAVATLMTGRSAMLATVGEPASLWMRAREAVC